MRLLPVVGLATVAALAATTAPASKHIRAGGACAPCATVDLGAPGDSVGDLLTFGNPVYDAANKVQLGRDQGYCVRVAPGKSWECIWTLMLKDGQITVEGPFLDQGDSLMAITGGTGIRRCQGQHEALSAGRESSSYTFTYDLL